MLIFSGLAFLDFTSSYSDTEAPCQQIASSSFHKLVLNLFVKVFIKNTFIFPFRATSIPYYENTDEICF